MGERVTSCETQDKSHSPRGIEGGHSLGKTEPEKCREAVSLALGVERDMIRIDRCQLSPSKLFLRSCGMAQDVKFFAKTYLVETLPFEARFELPWEARPPVESATRSVAQQIDAEWEFTKAYRELGGLVQVPRQLGKSNQAKTIAWEFVDGQRVDGLVNSSRWGDPRGRSLEPAFLMVGAWLENTHRASFIQNQWLDLGEVESSVRDLIVRRNLTGSKYAATALKAVQGALLAIGDQKLAVPVTLNHGDLCTANLIWNGTSNLLSVVDFEHCGYHQLTYDLISFLFNLNVHKLNPWVPHAAINALEESFWAGYGPIPRNLFAFVKAMAFAAVFYHYLPRVATRRKRRGWRAGLVAAFYRRFFEARMVIKRLGVPPELWNASSS